MEYLSITMTVIGWILVAGAVLLGTAPLQFLLKGESPLGREGTLHYFLAFCSSLSLAWGLILLVAADNPLLASAIVGPCAIAFATMSLWRIPLSRHHQVIEKLGKAPAAEVWLFAAVAAYFGYVWLAQGAV